MNEACKYGEERLAGLLYEDCDADEMIELRAHLAECAGCRAELEELTSTKELLSAWPNAVNAPRMVYVNEQPGLQDRLRAWIGDIGGAAWSTALRPAVAAAAVVAVIVVSVAVLDLRVAPDGRVRIGLAGAADVDTVADASDEAGTPISREEFREGMAEAVSYLEDLYRTRNDEERQLLMAAIDQRMQEQGLTVSRELRGVVDAALTDLERQHESDLGLVFSAVDELGLITATELQRMNTILASLVREPGTQE